MITTKSYSRKTAILQIRKAFLKKLDVKVNTDTKCVHSFNRTEKIGIILLNCEEATYQSVNH